MAFLPFLSPSAECTCSYSCSEDPAFSCPVTFQWINTNLIQDDSFDFFIISPNGSERFVGNINGRCRGGTGGCQCAQADIIRFSTTITKADITTGTGSGSESEENPCGTTFSSCLIRWRAILVAANGCGTGGSFSIFGACGINPNSGSLGGAVAGGTIDLATVCCANTNPF